MPSPTTYGLSADLANSYHELHESFKAAYQAALDPITRTKGKILARNDARKALTHDARLLARIIEGQATVTDEMKANLGLNVRKDPTPIPAPETSPKIDFVSIVGHEVRIRLHDVATGRRGRPEGVAGASVFSYVGPTPPNEIADWKFETSTTRTVVDVQFDSALEPGTKFWLTAFWFNPRAHSGPACTPVSAKINFGGLAQAA